MTVLNIYLYMISHNITLQGNINHIQVVGIGQFISVYLIVQKVPCIIDNVKIQNVIR